LANDIVSAGGMTAGRASDMARLTEVSLATPPADDARFAFGRNWSDFLGVLTEERINSSVQSLEAMLPREKIEGASFLDVGSGSGLSSLAASRLGAARIHSFDYDRDSVACTEALRRRYGPAGLSWTVEQGSVLDRDYLATLGQWDIVYSWGVLHHTGAMWTAIENVTHLVKPGGILFIAIYNDQGKISEMWTTVKRVYNTGVLGRVAVLSVFVPYFAGRDLISDAIRGKNPVARYHTYQRKRGMSIFYDWKDWLGGYPFEVATPDAILDFCGSRGFVLEKLHTDGSLGCNEFVFRRTT
jgi:2-polyprenyl-6-hydroxyphenyl methylase/3-demethylubiquinone-9 3-methyltransferase